MIVQMSSHTFKNGLRLVRYFKSSADQECGTVTYYETLAAELLANSLEYYNQLDGTNKFLKSTTLHVYGFTVPYPAQVATFLGGELSGSFACCYKDVDRSDIHVRYMGSDPAKLDGQYSASITHEFGHAYHYWCGWPSNTAWGAVMAELLSKQYCPSGAWPAGTDLFEAFANVYRFFKGTKATRGVVEPLPPEMPNPASNLTWSKQLNLMPETCAFMRAHGAKPRSLTWQRGSEGFWQFQDAKGQWVAHTDHYGWHRWVWSWAKWTYDWEPFEPKYSRT